MLLQELERSWDPWRQLDTLQDAMTQVFRGSRSQGTTPYPALNAWTDDHEVIVTAEVPGIDPNKLDVSVVGDTLMLRGSRTHETLAENATLLRQERSTGTFVRSLQLPFHVEADKVTARTKDGVLTITLPRAEAEKPKRINLKAD